MVIKIKSPFFNGPKFFQFFYFALATIFRLPNYDKGVD